MGLTDFELEIIKSRLGRDPTPAEIALFTSHWSEHCSYKSTRRWLRQLPSKAPWVARGPGTDAPLVEIAPGLYVTFKIESHNHPSAVDPYNGAATGVGGIIRDILTVGARPVGLLVNLHFGQLEHPHARWIAVNVVRGISDYGNKVGVPVVGGETWFDSDLVYTPIVLATCIGVVKAGEVPKGDVKPGDWFIVAGSGADKSGLAGSAFASKTLTEEEDLGAVQVADPLMGKRLIDLVQEAKTCVKYIKDLGGGGLATAAAELAEWFNLGLELNLDAIHKADIDIGPVEVLTGETQERLVFITDNLQCLQELFEKYDVPYSILGRFTEGKKLVFRWKGSVVVDIPISLAAEAPEVEWPEGGYHPPEVPQLSIPPIEKAVDRVLSSPNVAKKEAIYQRFDFDVGVRTVLKPGEGDAAALKLYEYNNLGIVVKGDANPRYTYLSPRLGAANVFVKTYRNVVAAGGRPLAAVDSINLGSPARAEVYWQFKEVVRGLAEAAAALDVPIVGGKVSLYNEKERPIKPVVVVVVLGKADMSSLKRAMWRDRDKVFIHGVTRGEIGGSEYLYRVFGLVAGRPPAVDYRSERELAELMARFHITGATDVGLGGLAVAFAKLAVNSGVGAEIDICKAPAEVTRVDYLLFSESNGRLVTTGESGPGVEVGSVGGEELVYRCGSTVLYKRGVKELEELMTLRF